MKRFLLALGLLGIGLDAACAQSVVAPCVTTFVTTSGASQQNCARVSAINPFPVTGTITAITGAAATAAAPSYVEGTSNPFSQNLLGDLRTSAKQSGTWTIQPGNTANTTAWLVTGTVASVQASATPKGGAITTGGTAQTLAAVNTARKGVIIQNPCSATEQGITTAENLYLNLTSAATVSSSNNIAVLPPCSSFSLGLTAGLVSTELISVNATTTAHIWYAKEF